MAQLNQWMDLQNLFFVFDHKHLWLSVAQTTILPVYVAMLSCLYTYANQAIAFNIPQSVIWVFNEFVF